MKLVYVITVKRTEPGEPDDSQDELLFTKIVPDLTDASIDLINSAISKRVNTLPKHFGFDSTRNHGWFKYAHVNIYFIARPALEIDGRYYKLEELKLKEG
jgi:hypothetical protein